MSDNQLSYAGRAPCIRETGNGPLGADSEAKWMVAMLKQMAESLMRDAQHDKGSPELGKHRSGQLIQQRLNLIAAAEFIETSSSLLAQREAELQGSELMGQWLGADERRCGCVTTCYERVVDQLTCAEHSILHVPSPQETPK